jgi:hypothetical protein
MQVRAVVTLEEAAQDLDAGKAFYDEKGEGIGLYSTAFFLILNH